MKGKNMPSIWTLIAELLTLLAQYGPQAATILATAWGYLKTGDLAGLAAYIESLILNPRIPILPADVTKLKALADGFRAHAKAKTAMP